MISSDQPYFIIIPSEVRLDRRLSPYSKLLYGEIKSKCNSIGYCWANNNFFSEMIGCDVRSIQRYIKQLEDFGYLTIKLIMGKTGTERNIYINEIGGDTTVIPPTTILSPPHDNPVTPPMTDESQGDDRPVTHIREDNNKKRKYNKTEQLYPVEISTGVEKELFTPCKDSFLDFYKEKFKTDYYFTAMDGDKLKSILKKVVKKTKEKYSGKKEKFLIEDIKPGFDWFYTQAYELGGNWIQSNFSLKNLDTQFNEIYTTIKDGKKSANSKNNRNGAYNKSATNEGVVAKILDSLNK